MYRCTKLFFTHPEHPLVSRTCRRSRCGACNVQVRGRIPVQVASIPYHDSLVLPFSAESNATLLRTRGCRLRPQLLRLLTGRCPRLMSTLPLGLRIMLLRSRLRRTSSSVESAVHCVLSFSRSQEQGLQTALEVSSWQPNENRTGSLNGIMDHLAGSFFLPTARSQHGIYGLHGPPDEEVMPMDDDDPHGHIRIF
jgi:hypothetical protein